MSIRNMPEALFGLAILLLGILVTVSALSIPVGFSYDAAGPRLFPVIIGIGMGLSGAAVVAGNLVGAPRQIASAFDDVDWLPVVLISAALLAAAMLIHRLGWIPVAALAFAAGARAFGDRRLGLNLAIGVVFAAAILIAFNFGLGLNLPLGPLAALLPEA